MPSSDSASAVGSKVRFALFRRQADGAVVRAGQEHLCDPDRAIAGALHDPESIVEGDVAVIGELSFEATKSATGLPIRVAHRSYELLAGNTTPSARLRPFSRACGRACLGIEQQDPTRYTFPTLHLPRYTFPGTIFGNPGKD